MKCPACSTHLHSRHELHTGLSAVVCTECGGQWISNKNYRRWLSERSETLPEKPFVEIKFDALDTHSAKVCPECGKILLKYKVGHGLDFYVDHCSTCGGIWLDKNEWKALEAKHLHDEIHRIFSTSWQNEVRREHMAEKLDEVYRNRFGPEIYDRAKEIRDWLQTQPQQDALLAFLRDQDPYKI
ncbi:MAG: zf-TFIIB domain-containing protein [Kiritimatiellae bacterium]|jgi:Zn-finger nucleic acid-binding protein|nr:zf-TFIIB domain-containing protein [Kiritimatiellia bacterium]